MTDIVAKLKSPATVFYEYSADKGALLKEAAAEIEKLRAALKPFALTEHQIERWYGMDVSDSHNVVSKWVTVGDLRAAAAALKGDGR